MATIGQLAKAHRLHDQGKSYPAIAKACGVTYATARCWLDSEYREMHRERERTRKARYGGTCLTCGGITSYRTGGVSDYCKSCGPAAHAKWTRDTVIAAIRRFNVRHGRPPTAPDFNPGMARGLGHDERAERFYSDGDYPHVNTVQGLFGTWSEGLRAAGFRPYAQGQWPRAEADPGGGHRKGAHLADEAWTIEDAA